jgi:hypothetical protein
MLEEKSTCDRLLAAIFSVALNFVLESREPLPWRHGLWPERPAAESTIRECWHDITVHTNTAEQNYMPF